MTFPSLIPSGRTFTPGNVALSEQLSLSGVRTGFRRGNRLQGQTLSLSFSNLTETQVNLIKDHYIDRQGTFDIFYLATETWNGYSSVPIDSLAYAWRYAGAPSISDGIVGRWGVEVELVTHPIDTGDLVIDGLSASATVSRTYNVDSGIASDTPARTQIINPGLAA